MSAVLGRLKQSIKKNKKLEWLARRLVCVVPYSFRKLDNDFWSYYRFLFELEKKSVAEVQEYQFGILKKLVKDAYEYAPFYRKKYDATGFHPDQLQTIKDIVKIPPITKFEIRESSKDMLLTKHDLADVYATVTSGTTGKALKFYETKKIEAKEWASICYQWARIGYKPGDGRIEFRSVVPAHLDYIYNPDEKMLRINIVKMSPDNIHKILKKISEVNYKFVHGYPSAVYKLAKILKSEKIEFKPKAVMMASEVIYDWQLNLIDDVFQCPKMCHYGLAEKTGLGAWDQDRKYYFLPSYAIVEHDPQNSEMIGTSLLNNVMPFIRYRMSDCVGGFTETSQPGQKSLFPIVDTIFGRHADFTYNEKGGIVSPALVTFPFNKLVVIRSVKIIQHAIEKFDLILEVSPEQLGPVVDAEVTKMLSDLKSIYGVNSIFNVQFVNEIPLDKSGKYRWIECRIDA